MARADKTIQMASEFEADEPEEILGEGAGGIVKRGTHQMGDRRVPCAIKVCAIESNVHNAQKEADILRRVGPRKTILKFLGEHRSETTYSFSVELLNGGDLMKYLEENGPPPLDDSQAWFAQMADAVHHLHASHNVAHLDIKFHNMLLDESRTQLKLCDFGLSQIRGDPNGRWGGELLPPPHSGTKEFAAPEIIKRRDVDGFKADLWSLGFCLFTLVAGHPPFENGASDSDDVYTYEARASNSRLSTRAGTRAAQACPRFACKEARSPRPWQGTRPELLRSSVRGVGWRVRGAHRGHLRGRGPL